MCVYMRERRGRRGEEGKRGGGGGWTSQSKSLPFCALFHTLHLRTASPSHVSPASLGIHLFRQMQEVQNSGNSDEDLEKIEEMLELARQQEQAAVMQLLHQKQGL